MPLPSFALQKRGAGGGARRADSSDASCQLTPFIPRARSPQLASWVKSMRKKKARIAKEGLEHEVLKPGQKVYPRTLTLERVERMNALGFKWVCSTGVNVSWEDRFQELLQYHHENGRWPSQAGTGLGGWVHKQRQKYSRREPKYMKERAPKVRTADSGQLTRSSRAERLLISHPSTRLFSRLTGKAGRSRLRVDAEREHETEMGGRLRNAGE